MERPSDAAPANAGARDSEHFIPSPQQQMRTVTIGVHPLHARRLESGSLSFASNCISLSPRTFGRALLRAFGQPLTDLRAAKRVIFAPPFVAAECAL